MKQILFRGQRADNRKWIEGFYFYKDRTQQHAIHCSSRMGVLTDNEFEVIPETIGQFTGLTDKNGKEIFKGDVLIWGGDRGAFFEVFWHDYECRYSLRVHWQGNRCGGYVPSFDANHSFEIIGNIHDNPELK